MSDLDLFRLYQRLDTVLTDTQRRVFMLNDEVEKFLDKQNTMALKQKDTTRSVIHTQNRVQELEQKVTRADDRHAEKSADWCGTMTTLGDTNERLNSVSESVVRMREDVDALMRVHAYDTCARLEKPEPPTQLQGEYLLNSIRNWIRFLGRDTRHAAHLNKVQVDNLVEFLAQVEVLLEWAYTDVTSEGEPIQTRYKIAPSVDDAKTALDTVAEFLKDADRALMEGDWS